MQRRLDLRCKQLGNRAQFLQIPQSWILASHRRGRRSCCPLGWNILQTRMCFIWSFWLFVTCVSVVRPCSWSEEIQAMCSDSPSLSPLPDGGLFDTPGTWMCLFRSFIVNSLLTNTSRRIKIVCLCKFLLGAKMSSLLHMSNKRTPFPKLTLLLIGHTELRFVSVKADLLRSCCSDNPRQSARIAIETDHSSSRPIAHEDSSRVSLKRSRKTQIHFTHSWRGEKDQIETGISEPKRSEIRNAFRWSKERGQGRRVHLSSTVLLPIFVWKDNRTPELFCKWFLSKTRTQILVLSLKDGSAEQHQIHWELWFGGFKNLFPLFWTAWQTCKAKKHFVVLVLVVSFYRKWHTIPGKDIRFSQGLQHKIDMLAKVFNFVPCVCRWSKIQKGKTSEGFTKRNKTNHQDLHPLVFVFSVVRWFSTTAKVQMERNSVLACALVVPLVSHKHSESAWIMCKRWPRLHTQGFWWSCSGGQLLVLAPQESLHGGTRRYWCSRSSAELQKIAAMSSEYLWFVRVIRAAQSFHAAPRVCSLRWRDFSTSCFRSKKAALCPRKSVAIWSPCACASILSFFFVCSRLRLLVSVFVTQQHKVLIVAQHARTTRGLTQPCRTFSSPERCWVSTKGVATLSVWTFCVRRMMVADQILRSSRFFDHVLRSQSRTGWNTQNSPIEFRWLGTSKNTNNRSFSLVKSKRFFEPPDSTSTETGTLRVRCRSDLTREGWD